MKGKMTAMAAAVAVALLAPAAAKAGATDCAYLTNFATMTYYELTGGAAQRNMPGTGVTCTVKVATPSLMVNKISTPTVQGSGGTVTFCIYFQNLSFCATAYDVLIADKVPDNMNWLATNPSNATFWTNGPNNGTQVREFSLLGVTWTLNEPPWALSSYTQYYLRWAYPELAPRESGVICFQASIK